MIPVEMFEHINYRAFEASGKAGITDIIGLDTEADETGRPFLCCLSDGSEIMLEAIPQVFFFELMTLPKDERKDAAAASRYVNKHYSTYNLKYDSGALLYFLSIEEKKELWEFGDCTLTRGGEKFRAEYIPHKYLAFHWSSYWVKIWDICQYFKMSLEKAALTYLNKKGKLEIETKTFTAGYVAKHRTKIKNYCIKDAVTCAELSNFLVEKLREFGIRCTALYSSASLSYEYFSSRCNVITVSRFWKYYPRLIRYAIESYKGGKFEITARGHFENAKVYDIVSAYPYEISNLVDISKARVIYSKTYVRAAIYGFLRVKIKNDGKHIPCAIKNPGDVDIYPCGVFYNTITKQEYDYLKEIGVDCEIESGYWLIVNDISFPYRDIVDELFQIKKRYKGKDLMLTEVSKRMLNSWYGKTLQIIENKRTGDYEAGRPWNPIYGAIITANTRIKITRLQNLLGPACLAVHTDSVLSLQDIPKELNTAVLGGFEEQERGDGILIACGQYQIGDKGAYKGFKPAAGDDWINILKSNGRKEKIAYPALHVESWTEAIAKGHYDRVNLFQDTKKIINLNQDSKRIWETRTNCRRLLTELEYSMPLVVLETRPPELWKQEFKAKHKREKTAK